MSEELNEIERLRKENDEQAKTIQELKKAVENLKNEIEKHKETKLDIQIKKRLLMKRFESIRSVINQNLGTFRENKQEAFEVIKPYIDDFNRAMVGLKGIYSEDEFIKGLNEYNIEIENMLKIWSDCEHLSNIIKADLNYSPPYGEILGELGKIKDLLIDHLVKDHNKNRNELIESMRNNIMAEVR